MTQNETGRPPLLALCGVAYLAVCTLVLASTLRTWMGPSATSSSTPPPLFHTSSQPTPAPSMTATPSSSHGPNPSTEVSEESISSESSPKRSGGSSGSARNRRERRRRIRATGRRTVVSTHRRALRNMANHTTQLSLDQPQASTLNPKNDFAEVSSNNGSASASSEKRAFCDLRIVGDASTVQVPEAAARSRVQEIPLASSGSAPRISPPNENPQQSTLVPTSAPAATVIAQPEAQPLPSPALPDPHWLPQNDPVWAPLRTNTQPSTSSDPFFKIWNQPAKADSSESENPDIKIRFPNLAISPIASRFPPPSQPQPQPQSLQLESHPKCENEQRGATNEVDDPYLSFGWWNPTMPSTDLSAVQPSDPFMGLPGQKEKDLRAFPCAEKLQQLPCGAEKLAPPVSKVVQGSVMTAFPNSCEDVNGHLAYPQKTPSAPSATTWKSFPAKTVPTQLNGTPQNSNKGQETFPCCGVPTVGVFGQTVNLAKASFATSEDPFGMRPSLMATLSSSALGHLEEPLSSSLTAAKTYQPSSNIPLSYGSTYQHPASFHTSPPTLPLNAQAQPVSNQQPSPSQWASLLKPSDVPSYTPPSLLTPNPITTTNAKKFANNAPPAAAVEYLRSALANGYPTTRFMDKTTSDPASRGSGSNSNSLSSSFSHQPHMTAPVPTTDLKPFLMMALNQTISSESSSVGSDFRREPQQPQPQLPFDQMLLLQEELCAPEHEEEMRKSMAAANLPLEDGGSMPNPLAGATGRSGVTDTPSNSMVVLFAPQAAILHASSQWPVKSLSGALAGRMRKGEPVVLIISPAGGGVEHANHCAKALCIARSFLKPEGVDLLCRPEWTGSTIALLCIPTASSMDQPKIFSDDLLIRVAGRNAPPPLHTAGLIANRLRNYAFCLLLVMGGEAVLQAMRALCVAHNFLRSDVPVWFLPKFVVMGAPSACRSGMEFHVRQFDPEPLVPKIQI